MNKKKQFEAWWNRPDLKWLRDHDKRVRKEFSICNPITLHDLCADVWDMAITSTKKNKKVL